MDRTYSNISLDLDLNQLLEGDTTESSSESSSSPVSVVFLHRHDGQPGAKLRADASGDRIYVPKEVVMNGAKLAALNQTGDFTFVRTARGVEGFIKSSHLTRAVNEGEKAVLRRYDEYPTCLRQQPCKENCWVPGKPMVHNNDPVFIVHSDTNGEFTFVRAENGAQGYVKSQYLVPADATVTSSPVIPHNFSNKCSDDDFKLMLHVYQPIRAWAERRYGAHPTRRLMEANGWHGKDAVVQAASKLALAMSDKAALAEVDAKMGSITLSGSAGPNVPSMTALPAPQPTPAPTLSSQAGEKRCHEKKCHVCCGTIGVHKNTKLGVMLDDRCRKQLATFQQGRTITERRDEWIAALQAMPGHEVAEKMLEAILEPEEARAAKKRKYKLEKAAEEQSRQQDQVSLLGKRSRAHGVPFPIMPCPQHEMQLGSSMEVDVMKERGGQLLPAMDRTSSEVQLESWVSEQMPHLVGQNRTTITTTTLFAHTAVPQMATMTVEPCAHVSEDFVVEDIADLSAAMEASTEEDREWEGRRVVMLNGKHAGCYGVVQRRTAKKFRIQLDGVPYTLEFYAGSFALAQARKDEDPLVSLSDISSCF